MNASPEILHWQSSGASFDFEGHRVFYQDSGAGEEAILLVHGFPTASWDWHHVWHACQSDYRLITADMLGFGFSDKPDEVGYSIHLQADLQERLLSHLQVDTVHILAHDYGATVAQELVARYNARAETDYPYTIRSLALLNGGLFPEQHRQLPIQTLLASPAGGLVSRLVSRSVLEDKLYGVFGEQTRPSPQEKEDIWYMMSRQRGHKKGHKMIHYIADRKQHRTRWVEALQTTEIPLLLINGVADPVSGGHMADRYEELIPNPQVVRLAEIGHYPQLEAPRRVIDAYRSFLASL